MTVISVAYWSATIRTTDDVTAVLNTEQQTEHHVDTKR